jgi:adenylate cyclase
MHFDMWSDDINIAARMEAHGEPGRIHVSQSVVDQASVNRYVFLERGRMDIKGMGPMTTYFLTHRVNSTEGMSKLVVS